MWISKQIVEAGKRKPAADVSRVRSSEGSSELKPKTEFVYCGPWGILYAPPSYAQAVVVETNKGAACVGTAMENPEGFSVEPGELLLFSKGNACIYLKNNGEVEINGKVFPAAE